MGSSFYNLTNPSTALLSRTHFPTLAPKDSSLEFFQFLHHYNGCCSYFRNRENRHFKKMKRVKAGVGEVPKWRVSVSLAESVVTKGDDQISKQPPQKKLKILVAGGGIGGLVVALAAKRKGFEVVVFEKDLSAIRGEGQYRGPIQIQSNALAALEAIDMNVAEEILSAGCITGDRINGLVDGISGKW